MKIMDISLYDKYLPAGTVILLKNEIRSIMIMGFIVKDNDDIKDYLGVYYPEGYIGDEYVLKFNHDDILGIINMGLEFDKQKEYNSFLKNEIEEYKF